MSDSAGSLKNCGLIEVDGRGRKEGESPLSFQVSLDGDEELMSQK